MAVELVVQMQHESSGFAQVRVYHSTWPLSGQHKLRAPIVWPAGALHEPPVVERYFRAIGAAADIPLRRLSSSAMASPIRRPEYRIVRMKARSRSRLPG